MSTTDSLSAKDIVLIITSGRKSGVKEIQYKDLKVVYNLGDSYYTTNQVEVFKRPIENLSDPEIPNEINPIDEKNKNKEEDNSDLIYTDALAFENSLLRME